MKVLIAEDERVSQKRLEKFLAELNYDVVVCGDGKTAWDVIQSDPSIRIYLLDWLLPGMEGPDLCRKIRSMGREPYRYIMMITSKKGRDDLVTGMEAGADDYLVKPFYPQELRVRLRAARRIIEFSTELMEARDLLFQQAAYDGLTGALNREVALKRLVEELERGKRMGRPTGVIMADLDHFKKINDTYGHMAGDQVLRETVRRIKETMREYDVIGRYGGEEFVLILPDVDLENAKSLAERIRLSLQNAPIDTTEGVINASVSVGLKVRPPDGEEDANACLRAADKALYISKSSGRNRVTAA